MSKASLALSNLRAVVIVIVLAFHSCLAYLASAPAQNLAFDQAPYRWVAFPIVDSHRWLGFDIFCAWQDVSLMALMFFLSGLFTASSLRRKGSWTYFADRLWRIGLPFVLALAFLSPLALYPAYATRVVHPGFAGFWQQWLSLPFWPTGPEWFLWELLVINGLAAALFAVAPRCVEVLDRFAGWACRSPARLFGLLVAASVVAYVPLALAFSPWDWSEFGPFSLQNSRPAIYVLYFFAAFAIGTRGLDRGLLACDGPLARRWVMWLGTAVVSFGVWAGLTGLTQPDWAAAPVLARLGSSLAYAVACPAACLFLLAVCLRFAHRRRRALDSLSANAYAMYLVHYVFVVWLQYALVAAPLPAIAKALIVFAGTLVLSWAACLAFARMMRGMSAVAAGRSASPVVR